MSMPEESGFWSRFWSKRPWVQLLFLVLANSWFTQNITKAVPCPGLNCYACPLAAFSCPIGSLQHFAGVRQIPTYLLGVLGLIGALGGRVACGWLCPFGWLQEQVHKIPVRKWAVCPRKRAAWWVLLLVSLAYGAGVWGMVAAGLPNVVLALYLTAGVVLYAWLGASRIFALVGLSLLMPVLTLEPWFSKLCPAGMLEGGISQVLLDADLRSLIGPFFWLKLAILLFFVGWMAVTRRPFCRWICPLGAIWSPFNRCSTLQLRVDQAACIRCDRCQKVCPVDIRIYEGEADPACVRCMQCVNECPVSCIGVDSLLTSR
jgi:polyferredoxin